MTQPIYLDYNATTPVDKEVLEAMLPYFSDKFGNAASRTHSFGWVADGAVEVARKQVANCIDATDREIVFTSGATESINLALRGVFENYQTKGKHIVTCKTEHKAVLDTCKALEEKGATITYLDVDTEGLINLKELENAITDQTVLVCIMYANNETGVIQPIKQIAEIVHNKGSIFMSDAAQAVGKIPVNVNTDGIDVLCMSGHKIYGPKGIGVLYLKRRNPRVVPFPQITGGGHENGFRSGTLNVPAIVGLGKACELISSSNYPTAELRNYMENQFLKQTNCVVNGSKNNRLPNTLNISFKGIKADELIAKLPNLAISMGSACTSANPQPSHVLAAMGLSQKDSYSSVRISLGKQTTKQDVEFATNKLITEVKTNQL